MRPHGRVKYVVEKCRCDICREGARLYEKERQQRLEPAYVGADPARKHIEFLRSQGIGLKQIAKTAEVSHGALSKLVYGERGRAPSKRIRRATSEAILSVTPSMASDGSRVPAGPTIDAINKLVALGVPKMRIAERLGNNGPLQVTGKGGYVFARTARIISEMLREAERGQLVTFRGSPWGAKAVQPPPVERQAPEDVDDIDDLVESLAVVLEERIDQSWRASAACRNRPPWIFFPGRGDRRTLDAARKICASCTVRDQCLEDNLDAREGVYAGTTPTDRAALRTTGKGRPKLSPEQVAMVRAAYEQNVSAAILARRFGVTTRTIHRIVEKESA